MEPIIIDTDAGDDIDDVLAIAFAARRPELNLLAVTTVTWDSHRRAALVRQVLDACGRSDVPVAAGAQLPLQPLDDARRRSWRDEQRMNHCPPAGREPSPAARDAVSLLARTIAAHPEPVTLVGIGPATNLALLLCCHPELAPRIKAFALMGGEIHLRRGEHNFACDLTAVQHLLGSGIPLFLGTWSVTRQVVLMPPDCEQLRRRDSPLANLLTACCDRWMPLQTTKPGPVMYDLAPILWRFRPDLFQTEHEGVALETTGALTRGWLVATHGPANAEVTTSMEHGEAKRMLMDTLLA